jgi:hypothetical protein
LLFRSQYGRANIDAAKKTTRKPTAIDEDDDDEPECPAQPPLANGGAHDDSTKMNGHLKTNGNLPNGGNSVISREKVLLPEAESNNKNNNKGDGIESDTVVKDDDVSTDYRGTLNKIVIYVYTLFWAVKGRLKLFEFGGCVGFMSLFGAI